MSIADTIVKLQEGKALRQKEILELVELLDDLRNRVKHLEKYAVLNYNP